MKLLSYVVAFFLFSFLGWAFENFAKKEKHYDNLLKTINVTNAPFLWIYGVGAVLLLLIYNYVPGPLLFKIIIAVLVVNLMECIGGVFSYNLYGYQTRSYSRNMMPMCGGYISVITAVFWALLIAVFYLLLDGFKK